MGFLLRVMWHLYIEIAPCSFSTQNISNVKRSFVGFHNHSFVNTVRCHYNVASFLRNPYKRHPIVHLLRQGIGCLLCTETAIYILSQPVQWCMEYHLILDLGTRYVDSTPTSEVTRSLSGTSAHSTMVTLVNIMVMNGWLTSFSFHVNRPSHSWD